jgi:aerobic carbon-monoxide dehydrogenase medium subunit
MIPASFEYAAPASVAEAISLLQQHGEDAKILAGGHSLLPAMKLRLAQPTTLIDISQIADLKGISVGSSVSIGAGTTYHAVANSADVQQNCAVVAQAAGQIGDIQVRNRGTIGGAIAHADPAADLTAVILALGGSVSVQGPGGSREIAADDLFVSIFTTALETNEIITKVSVPLVGKGAGASYAKMRHPASRYAIVGVAAYVTMSGGKVASARIAVTGAGPMAVRQNDAEAALVGTDGGEAAIAAAADTSGDGMEYLGDIHASAEYRKAMVKVYTRRALSAALAQAMA